MKGVHTARLQNVKNLKVQERRVKSQNQEAILRQKATGFITVQGLFTEACSQQCSD